MKETSSSRRTTQPHGRWIAMMVVFLLAGPLEGYGQSSDLLKLFMPSGIAVDSENRIYVSDTRNSRIVLIPAIDGKQWIACGEPGLGLKKFRAPHGIAVDSKNRIFVADPGNGQIVRMNDIEGTNWLVQASSAVSLALRAQGELIAISSRIMPFNENIRQGNESYGVPGKGKGQFDRAESIAVGPEGSIYIADTRNNRIVKIDNLKGENWHTYGIRGSDVGQFSIPSGIAVDSKNRIYVADSGNNRIVRIDNIGGENFIAYGKAGSERDEFMFPVGVAIDRMDRIYVTDQFNNRIVRIDNMEGENWCSVGN